MARQRIARITGVLLVAGFATSVDAQNTQRPLRPGQTKGPNFMVPVLRSS